MKKVRYFTGYTLVELMITVAIIGVLAAIAVPLYKGYISTSAKGTCLANAKSLANFEDNYFYTNNTYWPGTYVPGGTDTLTTQLSWTPSGDNNNFKYSVGANTSASCTGCSIANSYTVTVTYVPDPTISASVSKTPP